MDCYIVHVSSVGCIVFTKGKAYIVVRHVKMGWSLIEITAWTGTPCWRCFDRSTGKTDLVSRGLQLSREQTQLKLSPETERVNHFGGEESTRTNNSTVMHNYYAHDQRSLKKKKNKLSCSI